LAAGENQPASGRWQAPISCVDQQRCATIMEHMRRATVRDLRNRYTSLLRWIRAGEEIVITRRGKPVARLVPESTEAAEQVDWSQSTAVGRDRSHERMLTAEETAQLVHEAGGRW
jgi:prevent-host-death family protein